MLATVVIRHPKNISGINFFNMFNPFTGNNPCDIIYFCIGGLIYTYKNILEKVHIMKCKVLMVLGFLLNNICLFYNWYIIFKNNEYFGTRYGKVGDYNFCIT